MSETNKAHAKPLTPPISIGPEIKFIADHKSVDSRPCHAIPFTSTIKLSVILFGLRSGSPAILMSWTQTSLEASLVEKVVHFSTVSFKMWVDGGWAGCPSISINQWNLCNFEKRKLWPFRGSTEKKKFKPPRTVNSVLFGQRFTDISHLRVGSFFFCNLSTTIDGDATAQKGRKKKWMKHFSTLQSGHDSIELFHNPFWGSGTESLKWLRSSEQCKSKWVSPSD